MHQKLSYTLYDEIGGTLETNVSSRNLKHRIAVWWMRGYGEVYVDYAATPHYAPYTLLGC